MSEYPEGTRLFVSDMGPIERAYAEAEHEGCTSPPKGHPLTDHEPWSGGDLDGVETWETFTARLARHGLAIVPVAHPTTTPFELWEQAGGDRERYVALMREHGHIVPGKRPPGEDIFGHPTDD